MVVENTGVPYLLHYHGVPCPTKEYYVSSPQVTVRIYHPEQKPGTRNEKNEVACVFNSFVYAEGNGVSPVPTLLINLDAHTNPELFYNSRAYFKRFRLW